MAEHDDLPDLLPKKLGGPPKRQFKEGERVALSLRMTPELKRRLDAAAEAGGRSQSQEAEIRLEKSFERQDLLPEVLSLAYGRETAGFLMLFGLAMRETGDFFHASKQSDQAASRAERWPDNPRAYDNVVHAVTALLEMNRRRKSLSDPSFGHACALQLIKAVQNPGTRGIFTRYADFLNTIRSLLGPIARRMSKVAARRPLLPRRTTAPKSTDEARVRERQLAASTAADAVLALINASPRTPSREEIANVVLAQVKERRS